MSHILMVGIALVLLAGCSYTEATRRGDNVIVKTQTRAIPVPFWIAEKRTRNAADDICLGQVIAPDNGFASKVTKAQGGAPDPKGAAKSQFDIVLTDMVGLSTFAKGLLDWYPGHSYTLVKKCPKQCTTQSSTCGS